MADEGLLDVLERARRLGVLGPTPVADHLRHAERFVEALGPVQGTVVDLGSGAGLPGLVVARRRPDLRLVLLEANERRAALLDEAVGSLALGGRVRTLCGRAEEVGRDEAHRSRYDAVCARSFGAPAVVAECAAPLLRPGGRLVVSEPPTGRDRWPADGLALVGLQRSEERPPGVAVLVQAAPCPARYPRRTGMPAKRPLF